MYLLALLRRAGTVPTSLVNLTENELAKKHDALATEARSDYFVAGFLMWPAIALFFASVPGQALFSHIFAVGSLIMVFSGLVKARRAFEIKEGHPTPWLAFIRGGKDALLCR